MLMVHFLCDDVGGKHNMCAMNIYTYLSEVYCFLVVFCQIIICISKKYNWYKYCHNVNNIYIKAYEQVLQNHFSFYWIINTVL